MHCIILAKNTGSFPRVLKPIKGRAVIGYLIDDALLQKEISQITIECNLEHIPLVKKHIASVFPNKSIGVVNAFKMKLEEDCIILEGSEYTSLKLQDFIRFFRQFNTITKAAYDKKHPKNIPFTIIPKKYCNDIHSLPKDAELKTYNCGTGYSYNVYIPL